MLSHITAVVGIPNKYIYTRVCNWLYERYTSPSAFKSCMCDWRLRVVSGFGLAGYRRCQYLIIHHIGNCVGMVVSSLGAPLDIGLGYHKEHPPSAWLCTMLKDIST